MQNDSSEHPEESYRLSQIIEQLIDQHEFDEARIYANQLLLSTPADPAVYALLANIELNSGNVSVARRYMLEAIRSSPDSDVAKENLAYLDSVEIQSTDYVYMQQWFVWRIQHLDYPRAINVETVGRCNAKCNFCPHPELDRKFDSMSDKLFEKIVREASTFPPNRFNGFAVHSVNEPFMDRKIFDRLALINEIVPQASISITTNMNVMPPRFFERIRRIRNISQWNVSFNSAEKREYEETMRIDFDRTVANVKRLLHENRESPFVAAPITFSRVGTSAAQNTQFVTECEALFSEFVRGKDFQTLLLGKANWLGDVTDISPFFHGSDPCHQWVNFTVHCNGIVPHCCVDAKQRFPFGDVNKQSILEIYNGPHWRNLRQNVSGRDVVYPCNTCNLR